MDIIAAIFFIQLAMIITHIGLILRSYFLKHEYLELLYSIKAQKSFKRRANHVLEMKEITEQLEIENNEIKEKLGMPVWK